jgi:hypothetical protein
MKSMLLSKKTGQLGNRLTVFAHCIAAARERGYRLRNPAFCEYAPFFVGPRAFVAAADELPRLDPREPKMLDRHVAYALARVAYKTMKVAKVLSFGRVAVARARNEQPLDLKEVIDTAEARGCRWLILQGYHFRHHGWWTDAHAAFVRAFLAPAQPWRGEGEAAAAALRQDAEVVVGIHIRHGDYRQHLGGRFFWPVPTYVGFMRRMRELLAPKRIAFLVCSNAEHAPNDFDGFAWAKGPGHLVSDMQALAKCDYVLGPPSSFSTWAAWYGGARVLRIEEPEKPFALDDFRVLMTPDTLY